MQTIYAYRHPPNEPCTFQWFSLEQLKNARCPKCWWWTVGGPQLVPDNDAVVSYLGDGVMEVERNDHTRDMDAA